MNMSFGSALKKKLISLPVPKDNPRRKFEGDNYSPPPIKGCTMKEIEQLRDSQNVDKLPSVYVEFMLYLGRRTGTLFRGSDIVYQLIVNHNWREFLNEQLIKDDKEPVSPEHFVFMNHQGHTYWFFSTNAGEDPPVFWYREDSGEDKPDYIWQEGPLKYCDHLSELLCLFIKEREGEEEYKDFLQKYAAPLRK